MKTATIKEGEVFEGEKYVGTLCGSVGPHGESTGTFTRCKTTSPLTELGYTHIIEIGGPFAHPLRKIYSYE